MTEKPLQSMFMAVPLRYDLINRLITWGMDARWRELAAQACLANHPHRVLDLGCGTGDLAVGIARRAGGGVEITGVDYAEPMLELAREKAAGLAGVNFLRGNADNIPFADGYFDSVGISFAFRNLIYQNPLAPRHLAEVRRVLRDGGHFVAVESGQPARGPMRLLFRAYLRGYVYPVGRWLSGNRGAYRYLAESVARFYPAEEIREMLLGAGFREVTFRRLFLGAACLHVAVK
ncbi:MAG: ubiquinone/menaquinone biosynthesis methyltransferase [Chloroflexota bacterium]